MEMQTETLPIFEYDIKYMWRALQLAARSPYYSHPNPMVGAVIVADGRIIGEGWHRRCGQAHAEVNAVNSVAGADRHLLAQSTIYVTLEPCAHYGKTPPCAQLIIDTGIPNVVVGAVDPFAKVAGRGIAMMRQAGINVVTGVLADESMALNRRFMTAHTLHRPYITLKWAMSRDGYMDVCRSGDEQAYRFSNSLTTMLTHRQRALNDAILTTSSTVEADNPRLNVRSWVGPDPRRVVVDCHVDPLLLMTRLYESGVTSLLVETGPRWLCAMLDAGLWDEVRVEQSDVVLGERGAHRAPSVTVGAGVTHRRIGGIDIYRKNDLMPVVVQNDMF